MTGCQRVLARLQHGPATAAELYGLGVIVHSRVADLRSQGHRIVCDKTGPPDASGYTYRLLNETGGASAPPSLRRGLPRLVEQPTVTADLTSPSPPSQALGADGCSQLTIGGTDIGAGVPGSSPQRGYAE